MASAEVKDRIYRLILLPSMYLHREEERYYKLSESIAQEVFNSRTTTVAVSKNIVRIDCEDFETTRKMMDEATHDCDFILEAIRHLIEYRQTSLGMDLEEMRRELRGTIGIGRPEAIPWDKINAHDRMECEMVWNMLMLKMMASEF